MVTLQEMVSFCDERTRLHLLPELNGAKNGLQFENSGKVTKIGASVDAGIEPFRRAGEEGIDFLITHHGMLWSAPVPVVGVNRRKLKLLFDLDLSVYTSHLPLDAHPEIGNNALLARLLELPVSGGFLEVDGVPIASEVTETPSRAEIRARLQSHFAKTLVCVEAGPEQPEKIGILTGSGSSVVNRLPALGIDTLITGELKQEHFNFAQEQGLNLYMGGHYATETFAVCALAEEAAERFGLPWSFVDTACPL